MRLLRAILTACIGFGWFGALAYCGYLQSFFQDHRAEPADGHTIVQTIKGNTVYLSPSEFQEWRILTVTLDCVVCAFIVVGLMSILARLAKKADA